MKIRIGSNLKSGKSNYGSYGSIVEVELVRDDDITPEQAMRDAAIWQKACDLQCEEDQAKKALRYSEPQPTEPSAPSGARAFQDDRRSVEPPPRRFAEDIPPPSRRRPEPGYDEEPRDQEPPPRGQNGYGGRQQQRAVAQIDPPRNGSQLAAIVKKFPEWKEPVDAWGAAQKLQWKYTTWPDDAAQACWHDVTTRTTAGQWGGN